MPDRPLKVVRIIARLNIGGPARHVLILCEGLDRFEFSSLLVHGMTGEREGNLHDEIRARHVHAAQVPELGRRVRPWSDLRALLRLVRLLFVEAPDVVHTHTAKAGTLGRLAAFVYNAARRRSRRCLVVHTFHGHVFAGYFVGPVETAIRLAERLLAKATDVVVSISESQKRELTSVHRIADSDKVRVIPLGLELQSLLRLEPGASTLHTNAGWGMGDLVFGFVGRLVPIKDVVTLLEAFAGVIKQVPIARLLIVGDGPLRAELEEQARCLGIAEQVCFAGWQPSLPDVYRAIDVLMLTSRNEGTPVAIIEAMAAALPVIATDVGGISDVVADGHTGLLAPAGDSEALSDAMVRLATTPQERHELGSAGREVVRARFSAERLVADVSALYRNELRRKHSASRRHVR